MFMKSFMEISLECGIHMAGDEDESPCEIEGIMVLDPA